MRDLNLSLPKVVVLFGAECTGKSTLSRALSLHYQTLYNPEYVRLYLEERHRLGLIASEQDLTYSEVEQVALGQLISEKQTLVQAHLQKKDYIFLDTNLLSTAVYSREIYGKQPVWINQAIAEQPYDLYFFLADDFAWQADAQRSTAQSRTNFQQMMKAELRRRNIDFCPVSGSLQARIAFCKDYLERHYASQK
ncbi:MAG: ATP-binding protein [Bernardetiaceae bacterium]|nr:ATP-binding protein [Bernardetiaceae bacterium]